MPPPIGAQHLGLQVNFAYLPLFNSQLDCRCRMRNRIGLRHILASYGTDVHLFG